jgi:hypothetical protein
MHYFKYIIILSIITLTLSLSACFDEDHSKITAVNDPEIVAMAFFDALYNEKNVEKAASVCTPKLARLILHYRSPEAVGRHLFNMSFDKVQMSPDSNGVKVREQFKGNANITIYFDGFYQDSRMKDVKRLAIVQKKGKWFIDKLLKDPF